MKNLIENIKYFVGKYFWIFNNEVFVFCIFVVGFYIVYLLTKK